MKKYFISILLACITLSAMAQADYDSVTISRSRIGESWYKGKWADTLKAGRYAFYIQQEKKIWQKPGKPSKVMPLLFSLAARIKANGTDDVAKCFIPRHSINFYRGGKIMRYLLVCFECDGLRFSDDPPVLFIKSEQTREKQLQELKLLMKELL